MALLHVDFSSDALGMGTEMDVILPQKPQEPYQTLYLLHGMGGNHTQWHRRSSIERYVSDLGLAVIMPSTQLGWYTDAHIGHKWWTFLSRELPEICHSFFPLSYQREDTFAAGLSMGGYGAVKLGLAMGENFSHVATLSGGLDVAATCQKGKENEARPTLWGDVFGPADQVAGSDNDLFALAERRKAQGDMPKIFQWCGTADFLYEDNLRFRDHATKLGYDLTYQESPGDHNWKYWDEKIQDVLQWLPLRATKKGEQ
jgi:putative tributyrin esterase